MLSGLFKRTLASNSYDKGMTYIENIINFVLIKIIFNFIHSFFIVFAHIPQSIKNGVIKFCSILHPLPGSAFAFYNHTGVRCLVLTIWNINIQ
jgi:hypothetical protein